MNVLRLAAATSFLLGRIALAETSGPSSPDSVEMEVAGVFQVDDASAGVLVLRQKGGQTVLPIVIGRSEADQLETRLRSETSVRPRTQDLLSSAIVALGGRVVRVDIQDSSDALYRARVLVAQGENRVELDARPSDSVALAIGANAPIFAARSIIEASGLSPDDVDRMRKAAKPSPAAPKAAAPDQRM